MTVDQRWRAFWSRVTITLQIQKTAIALSYNYKSFHRWRSAPGERTKKVCRMMVDLGLSDEQILEAVYIAAGVPRVGGAQ